MCLNSSNPIEVHLEPCSAFVVDVLWKQLNLLIILAKMLHHRRFTGFLVSVFSCKLESWRFRKYSWNFHLVLFMKKCPKTWTLSLLFARFLYFLCLQNLNARKWKQSRTLNSGSALYSMENFIRVTNSWRIWSLTESRSHQNLELIIVESN